MNIKWPKDVIHSETFSLSCSVEKLEQRTSGGCDRLMGKLPQDKVCFINVQPTYIHVHSSCVFSDALIEFEYKN